MLREAISGLLSIAKMKWCPGPVQQSMYLSSCIKSEEFTMARFISDNSSVGHFPAFIRWWWRRKTKIKKNWFHDWWGELTRQFNLIESRNNSYHCHCYFLSLSLLICSWLENWSFCSYFLRKNSNKNRFELEQTYKSFMFKTLSRFRINCFASLECVQTFFSLRILIDSPVEFRKMVNWPRKTVHLNRNVS